MSRGRPKAAAAFALALALTSSPAWSHIGFAANDLYAGMLHPLLHFSTLLPLLAMYLWFSQISVRSLRTLAPGFLLAVLAGAVLALLYQPMPQASVLFLPFAVLLGAFLVFRFHPPLRVGLILVVMVGFLEGFGNVTEVRTQLVDPMLYIVGLLLALGLVMLHVVALLYNREQLWVRTGARVLGSWIVSAGVLVLVLQWSGYGVAVGVSS